MLHTALIVLALAAQSAPPMHRTAPFPAPRPTPPVAPLVPADAPEQVERPRLTSMPDPSSYYPAAAREAGRQGMSQLRCILTPDGVLIECAIHQSSGAADLDAAAFQVAAQARYTPMRVSGQAVKAAVIFPVRWVLAE